MWSDLYAATKPSSSRPPATLLTLAALQAGNGPLADIAVRHAPHADPDDRLAQLLARAITIGVDRNTISEMLAE
jgi:hypothetical protein